MSLPDEPTFLHFQTLVDEARQSIRRYCPEWTDYNVSDPGITLIELFAHMTSQLNYRLNRIPQRNYLEFLKMLGLSPDPPQPAQTELTFYLTTPFPLVRTDGQLDYTISTRIPANTEVATRRAIGADEEIIFVTQQERLVAPPRLTHLSQDFEGGKIGDEFLKKNHVVAKKISEGLEIFTFGQGSFALFQPSPKPGDAFYLGFDPGQPLAGYVLQLDFECEEDKGVGVTVKDPPLVWEGSVGGLKEWQTIKLARPEDDTTHGFNRSGVIKLYLPVELQPVQLRREEAYWLRCRLEQPKGQQKSYTASPIIRGLKVWVCGVTLPAINAAPLREAEQLGISTGEDSQQFELRRRPVLALDPQRGERLEVEEEQPDGHKQWVTWERQQDFAQSIRYDRHFVLDGAEGRIHFGPAVRQANGAVRQYGAIPPLGSRIRITGYCTSGGAKGNVAIGLLRVLKQPISYVAEVTNRQRAKGGQDAETFEALKLKAQAEMRSLNRAVTAADYEWLCRRHCERVARAKCLEFDQAVIDRKNGDTSKDGAQEAAKQHIPGWVRLLIVPVPERELLDPGRDPEQVELLTESEALKWLSRLRVEPELEKDLRTMLEPYRMLGVNLEITEPSYIAVKVQGKIRCRQTSNPTKEEVKQIEIKVKRAIIKVLVEYLDPVGKISGPFEPWAMLLYPALDPPGAWPFGGELQRADIYNKIKAVAGVEKVTELELQYYPLDWIELADLLAQEKGIPWRQPDNKEIISLSRDELASLVSIELEVTHESG